MSVLPYRLRKLVAVRPGLKTYQGTALADGAPVLIHHLHPTARAAEREERFERVAASAERIAALSHPALPALRFSTPRPEDPFYLVYDLPRGTGLDGLLDEGGPLPWEDAVALLAPVVDALAAAHEAGVCHLGLRPDRILLRPGSPPLLVDLGLTALLLADVPRPLAITNPLWRALYPAPELVAPELLAGADPDGRADVHGMGLLLFHLTTLAWPYSSGTSMLVYNQVRAGVRAGFLEAALGHVPPPLRALIAAATARDPADRPADGRALAAALDDLPPAASERGARRDAICARGRDVPYTDQFGEILTVVDGGRGRPDGADGSAAATPGLDAEGEPGGAAEPLDPERAAALEAERERQIRLAELTLERMRANRPTRRRGRVVGWLVTLLVVLGLAFLLPQLLGPSTPPLRRYEGGVDPSTGLTHGGPPAASPAPTPDTASAPPTAGTARTAAGDAPERPPRTAAGGGRRLTPADVSPRPRRPLAR